MVSKEKKGGSKRASEAALEAAVRKLEDAERLPEGLRDRVNRLLAKPHDKTELIEKLKLHEQYSDRIKTLSSYGFIDESGRPKEGDVPPPSLEEALAVFTPETLALAATFQGPTLLLVPKTSFASKVKAINDHKIMYSHMKNYKGVMQEDCSLDSLFKESDQGSARITGWQALIVDGAKEMVLKEGLDDEDLTFYQRVELRKSARKPGEKGFDRHTYAMLMMESLKKGDPIDKAAYERGGTFTLLDDDPSWKDRAAPNAYWNWSTRCVRFRHFGNGPGSDARLRSSVGGDI